MGCWGITAFESDAGLDAISLIRKHLPEQGDVELRQMLAWLKADSWNAPPEVSEGVSHTCLLYTSSHRLWRALSERRGEGYVDVIVLVLCAVMVLALAMRVLPVFIQKQQLDTFATELVREAEVSGRVGAETSLSLIHI